MRAACLLLPWLLRFVEADRAVPELDCQPGVSLLQGRSARRPAEGFGASQKPWDTRIFYTMGYHKTGSVLLIRLVQRAMVALGANLQNLVCRAGEKSNPTVTYPYFGIKKNDLKVGEVMCNDVPSGTFPIRGGYSFDAERWNLERSRLTIPRNGLRMVTLKRNPADVLASSYCYHHAGHGDLPLKSSDPQIPFPGIESMGPLEGMAAAAGATLSDLERLVNLMTVPQSDLPLMVGSFEDVTHSSEGFDKEVHRLLEFLLGDMVSDDQLRLAANATILEDHNRHLIDISDHVDDPECVKNARALQTSLPAHIQKRIQDLQKHFQYA